MLYYKDDKLWEYGKKEFYKPVYSTGAIEEEKQNEEEEEQEEEEQQPVMIEVKKSKQKKQSEDLKESKIQ